MGTQSTAALRKRRNALLRQLPSLQAILRGSLIERYKRCGKPGCKCADGPGHGPKYYLSVSYPGLRPQMDYVPQELYAPTAEFLANYHRTREILEAILRDQPRIAAPPRGALRDGRERNAFLAYGTHRCEIGWRASRQYARRLVARQPGLFGNCGGKR